MDAAEFLGLRATHNPVRWYLEVVPGICTDDQFLFGGCGLGAAIEALERTTGRPAVWASAQYLSFARPPEMMDIDVFVTQAGHQTTQARAVAHVGDRQILAVTAALGERDAVYDGQWATFPDVPMPDDCPTRERISRVDDSLARRLDMRVARGRDESTSPEDDLAGHSALWARFPAGLGLSAASLAVLGDYVPFGVAQVLGRFVTGSSLDNTIRVCSLEPTEWVLIDVHVDAITNGIGHGRVDLWSEDHRLLAAASQSCVVRPRRSRAVSS
jgi:acyl-CoA thioesterase